MKKPYLLIAGYDYYPDFGTNNWNDWIGCFATREEAQSKIIDRSYEKGDIRISKFEIIDCGEKNSNRDWVKIVDLRM